MIINNIQDNHITGFKVNDNIVADKKVVGTFVKNTAELEIINLNHVYDNLKGQYIDIQDFGKWYVNDLETNEEFTESTLKLNDITQKFDEDYEDIFPFPDTLKKWAIWIGNKVGVPLKGDFIKSDLILIERPYIGDNPKYRDAIKFIAKITGNYAQKNYDNTYSIKWFDNTKTKIEDWESFVHGNATEPTNVIVLSTGDTEDNVKWPEQDPEEPHELRIEDDWIKIDRHELKEVIYNQVNGFFYVPISKLEVPFGLLSLRAGQKIKTKDIELQDVETFISSVCLEWQGGNFGDPNAWVTSIKMEELTETNTNLKYASSVRNKLLKVERKADKNAGLIEDTIEALEGNKKEVASLKMQSNEIALKIENLEDDKAVTGASIIAKINNDESEIGINADKLKLEGYTTINKGFGVDLEGNAFMNGATINGGSIEMIDDGIEDEHSIKLYKGSDIEEVSRPIQVGDDLGDKILKLNFPNGFVGTATGPSIAFENLIVCENGSIRYVYGYQYSEAINIYYEFNNEYKDLYLDYDGAGYNGHNIQTNLKEITIPKGFGKVISINSEIKDTTNNKFLIEYFTCTYKNIKYSTEFNSNGVLIKKNNISSSYQGNGMRITDEGGDRYFNEHGISWDTPHGEDYYHFSVSKDFLLYYTPNLNLTTSSNSFELNFNGTPALRITENEFYAPSLEGWQSDKRLKENIEDSNYNALDIIKKIKHRQFKFKDKQETIAIGYVADELEELDKSLIFEVGKEKIKHPKQSYIIPILSKAIQEQQMLIEKMQKEINDLKEASK